MVRRILKRKGEGRRVPIVFLGAFIGLAMIIVLLFIGIPGVLGWQQGANEFTAVANLKIVADAERVLFNEDGHYGAFEELIHYRLIAPAVIAAAGGYDYSVTAEPYDFVATARPVSKNSGRYEYFVTAEGIVRYSRINELAPQGRAGLPVEPGSTSVR